MIQITFYILLVMTVACFAVSALTVVVSPGFHLVGAALGVTAVVFRTVRRSRKEKRILKLFLDGALLVFCVLLVDFTIVLVNPRERHNEYTSPSGTTTLIVEYDYVSRPYLYRKQNKLFMSRIPVDFGPGYQETVSHTFVWLSETEIRLEDPFGRVWDVAVR